MHYGKNQSRYEFEVLAEDGDHLAGFHTIEEASAFARAAPWYCGKCSIRRDRSIAEARHAETMALRKQPLWIDCA